ncbi:hypothetical protein MKK75_29530 [Methylobacterium sp. J-030]|uniref:hypothetical protein n=1 Tax=Methylobacterium sp. J-030 TaxID=2836627 RepID=UPI001FBBFBBF|nr:hypothetical protein [Methylobacterium sp. J-030]MCJ2072887.1 hypothetical protein [Methylobacterium sp. J-030]
MSATKMAFDAFRAQFGPARLPPAEAIANDDELRPMSSAEGLCVWSDGNHACNCQTEPSDYPQATKDFLDERRLWVVAQDEVLHAKERCAFGLSLETGVIKHTNITGGKAAFCGGEMIVVNDNTIILNGRSRRYGPRSSTEMTAVAKSFTGSGYSVWAMGYDDEAGVALPFQGTRPTWVA